MLITNYLKEHNVRAEIIKLETQFPTLKHIARYFNITEKQIFLNQLLQGENKRLLMCIYQAKYLLDFKKIEDISGIKRLRFADREIVQKTTGYEVGAIPIIGYISDFPIYIDKKLLEVEYGYGAAGEQTELMKVFPEDVVKCNQGVIVEIVR